MKTAIVAFKGVYQYDPLNKKEVKTTNSMIKNIGENNTLVVLPKKKSEDAFLFTGKHAEGFKQFLAETGSVFGPQEATCSKVLSYYQDKGIGLEAIKYTAEYEKLNFNFIKKGVLIIGRALKQLF